LTLKTELLSKLSDWVW